ncbi:MAG: diguanylate cyclase [Ruthenibacterium sp.]
MKQRTGDTRKKWRNALVLTSAALAAVLMVVAFLHAMRIEEQARLDQLINESTSRSAAFIRARLADDAALITQIGQYLGEHAISITAAEVLERVGSDEVTKKSFQNITVITPDGTLYGAQGVVAGRLSDRACFRAAMEGKVTVDSVPQPFNDKESILHITAPVTRDGTIIGAVSGEFPASSLMKLMMEESFHGHGCSCITKADGTILAQTESTCAAGTPNADKCFAAFCGLSKPAFEQMQQNMRDGKAAHLTYVRNSEQWTMFYLPLGINDWYLLSTIPNQIVSSYTQALMRQMLVLAGGLLAVLLLLGLYRNRERRASQETLAVVHEELLNIYNTIPGGIFKCRVDDGFTLISANDGFYRTLDYTKKELKEKFANQLVQLMQPEDVGCVRKSIAQHRTDGSVASDEVRLISSNGSVKWLLLCGEITRNAQGKETVYCCFTDISELKHTQEALRRANQRYDLIMAETQSIVFEWNPVDRSIRHSKIYEEKFGYLVSTENFPQCILEQNLVAKADEAKFLNLYRRLENGAHFSSDEIRIKKQDGTFLWCRISATAVLDDAKKLCSVVGIIVDIDAEKREIQAVTERARRDTMTGLYNKSATEQWIAMRLHGAVRAAAILAIDIDNFKSVNDTLGHAGGDAALIEVSKQLKCLFRETDIVGRVGGDEFVVFMDGMEPGADLEKKLADIAAVFNWSFCKAELECFISCSIGVALFPKDGSACAELLKKADAALYYAKKNGKNQVAIYSEKMQESIHGVEDAMAAPRAAEQKPGTVHRL